jgi:hypothetical protein
MNTQLHTFGMLGTLADPENERLHTRKHRPLYGASIERCFWLECKDTDNGLPFYLWDAKGKRTRVVKDNHDFYQAPGVCSDQAHVGPMNKS